MYRLVDFWEWLTRQSRLRDAEKQREEWDKAVGLWLSRAKACLALGEMAFKPAVPEALHLPEALTLYRSACFWLLRCKLGEELSLAQLLEREEFASRREILSRDLFEDAKLDPEHLRADALALRRLGNKLCAAVEEPERRLRELTRQSRTRCLAFGAILTVVSVGSCWAASSYLRGPNLAEGKPWRTSSVASECQPDKHSCAGGFNDIFFHTNEEDSPWIEIDLLEPTRFSTVEVKNRQDCCEERVAPLVVEVSDDRKKWREVLRKTEVFLTWKGDFAPTTARYVRLRVARRSLLHLEGIALRR